MRLAKAATKFDTVKAVDAYGTASFMCQLAPLELFKIDGAAVRKRQVSTAPGVVIPSRGVVTIAGEHYLVGDGTPDFWEGEVIRRNYVLQGADALADITSIAGALANTTPTQAYVAVVFSRYLPEAGDSSRLPPQYQIFLAGSETASADTLVKVGAVWYLIKQSYVSPSGLRIALANALDEPLFETVSFVSTTYDPVSDTSSTSGVSAKIMRVKWTEHYTYLSIGSETYERGDQQVFLPKTLTPKPSDVVVLSDGSWRILAVLDEGDRWSCHVRRS